MLKNVRAACVTRESAAEHAGGTRPAQQLHFAFVLLPARVCSMLLRLPLALLAALPLVAPSQVPLRDAPAPEPASNKLADLLYADPDYSKLVRLLQRARLIPTLNKLADATFFAPNNAAIDRFVNKKPSSAWATALSLTDDALLDDNVHEELRQHLFYHMLNYTTDTLPAQVAHFQTLYYPRKPTEPPSKDPPPNPPWLPIPGGSLGGQSQRLRLAAQDGGKWWAGVDSAGAGGVELVNENATKAANGNLHGLEDVIEQPANIRTRPSRVGLQ